MMNDITPRNEPLFDLSALNLQNLPETFPAAGNQAENQDGEKFVVFFLDDELFAVSAAEVAEIVRPLEFTPLPNSPAWLHGIANLRGQIISVLNLSKIFNKPAVTAGAKAKSIVLKPHAAPASIAFPVDRLSEVVMLAPADVQAVNDAFLFGTATIETVPVKLLDTEKLLASLL
ncbi:MAG TPA: chemotaxis protein CheW [Pyrinomonadaceae bacterium]|jgi:purine-binding chemotaxis protein CheW